MKRWTLAASRCAGRCCTRCRASAVIPPAEARVLHRLRARRPQARAACRRMQADGSQALLPRTSDPTSRDDLNGGAAPDDGQPGRVPGGVPSGAPLRSQPASSRRVKRGRVVLRPHGRWCVRQPCAGRLPVRVADPAVRSAGGDVQRLHVRHRDDERPRPVRLQAGRLI